MVKARYVPHQVDEVIAPPSLTTEEESIIRYVCGYVGMKLHDRFIKQKGNKAAEFIECIDSMQVTGPSSSCLDYTREWVDKVNRGGLFYVSDDAYNLFVTIEVAMQVVLTKHVKSSYKLSAEESKPKKENIISTILKDEDISYWYTYAFDVSDDQDALELLRHIVELWLTIRGFSISKPGWKTIKEHNRKQQRRVVSEKS